MKSFRIIAILAVTAALSISTVGCTSGESGTQGEPSQDSNDGDYTVENTVDVVYPDGSQETLNTDFYIPEKNPLTESEKGTISLFTDRFSSWGQLWSCGDSTFGFNGMKKTDDPAFRDNTTGTIDDEISRPEIIVADDEVATIVIASKGVMDSGDYPGYIVAVKNNSNGRIHVSGSYGEGTAKGNTVITTLNGTEVKASLAYNVDPGCWSYGSLTFPNVDYDEFANGVVEGSIVIADEEEEVHIYPYNA